MFQFAKFIFKEEVESSRIVLAVLWEFVLQSGYRSLGAILTFLDEITHAGDQTLHGRSSWMILNGKLISNL